MNGTLSLENAAGGGGGSSFFPGWDFVCKTLENKAGLSHLSCLPPSASIIAGLYGAVIG